MKQTVTEKKGSPVEPLIISRLQRATAAQIAREQARAKWRGRASQLFVGAIVAAIALRVLAMAMQPCLAAYRSACDIDQLRVQLRQEMERHEHLKSQISYLQSTHGVEEEARKLGWIKTGEVSLQIVTPEPPGTGLTAGDHWQLAKASADGKLPAHTSGSEHLRLTLTRWLEGMKQGRGSAKG
jgi:cell division protein FtsL